jgi:hypothetical protein
MRRLLRVRREETFATKTFRARVAFCAPTEGLWVPLFIFFKKDSCVGKMLQNF